MRKRELKLEAENSTIPSKTLKYSCADDKKLSSFLSWCVSEGVCISSKVKFSYLRGGVAVWFSTT